MKKINLNCRDLEMTNNQLNQARSLYLCRNYDAAANLFIKAFNNNPKAWWLALEAYRCFMSNSTDNSGTNIEKIFMFSPFYKINSYQKNIYESSSDFKYELVALKKFNFDKNIIAKLSKINSAVFHQHWLKEIYIHEKSIDDGFKAIDKHISHLKVLKCLGFKVIWTIHNIYDHDLIDYQKMLCVYALEEMYLISDIIHIHNYNTITELEKVINIKVDSKRFFVLEHPLYDNFLKDNFSRLPPELNRKTLGKFNKIILIAGRIKPYKGVDDFINAIKLNLKDFLKLNIHIIIAGENTDGALIKEISDLLDEYPNLLTVIPRVVDDEEMVGILKISNLMVLPYKAILTSGSFYSAVTFKLPVLAPQRGMFTEVITHNENGFLYNGTVKDLSDKLIEVCKIDNEVLRGVGNYSYKEKENNTIKSFSNSFFKKVSV